MEQRGRSTVSTYERVAARVPSCQSYYELAVALGMGRVSTGRTQPQVKNLLVKLRKHGPKLDVSHFKKSPPRGSCTPPCPCPRLRPVADAYRRRRRGAARRCGATYVPLRVR